MKVLIDTNVILDVLLNRASFVQDAIAVLELTCGNIQAYVSASAITDIYYIAYKELRDKIRVKNLIKTLLQIITVAGISDKEIMSAIDSDWADFEDSLQNAVAESHDCSMIITRNISDFNGYSPIYSLIISKNFLKFLDFHSKSFYLRFVRALKQFIKVLIKVDYNYFLEAKNEYHSWRFC